MEEAPRTKAGATLWEALGSVPDHRRAEGKRYPLASLLLIAIAAMLAGRRDQLGIVRWGRKLSAETLAAIGIELEQLPRLAHMRRQIHLVQTLAVLDHREHVFGLVGTEVHEHQTLFQCRAECFTQGTLDIGRVLDLHADVAVGLGDADEIR